MLLGRGSYKNTARESTALSAGHGELFCTCCNAVDIVKICVRAIKSADVIFAWLPADIPSVPAGAIWELGFARGLGWATHNLYKRIVIAHPEAGGNQDFWFAEAGADYIIEAETAVAAWREFINVTWPSDRAKSAPAPKVVA